MTQNESDGILGLGSAQRNEWLRSLKTGDRVGIKVVISGLPGATVAYATLIRKRKHLYLADPLGGVDGIRWTTGYTIIPGLGSYMLIPAPTE